MQSMFVCASHSPLLYCHAREPDAWGELNAAMAACAEAVAEFRPDRVFAFGSDHFNGFFLNNMPAFSIGADAVAEEDIGGTPGPLRVPSSEAVGCVEFLRANDVDPAVSYRMTVDHAFSQTLHNMTGALDAYPVIPVFINCMTAPFVPFRRTRLMGEAIGRYAASLEGRTLFLGSGGMSHHPTRYYPEPGQASDDVAAWQLSGGRDPASLNREAWLERLEVMHHEGAKMIVDGKRTPADMRLNPESDRMFLDVLERGALEEYDGWDPLELIERGGIGSMELQTWIAAAAAYRSCGGSFELDTFYAVTPELGIAAGIVRAG